MNRKWSFLGKCRFQQLQLQAMEASYKYEYLEYITAIEAACTKLTQQDAKELRADINRVLRSSNPPNPI